MDGQADGMVSNDGTAQQSDAQHQRETEDEFDFHEDATWTLGAAIWFILGDNFVWKNQITRKRTKHLAHTSFRYATLNNKAVSGVPAIEIRRMNLPEGRIFAK